MMKKMYGGMTRKMYSLVQKMVTAKNLAKMAKSEKRGEVVKKIGDNQIEWLKNGKGGKANGR